MDPMILYTVTSAAVVLATEVAKGAAGEAGKDAWTKIKSLLGWKAEPAMPELAPKIAQQLQADASLAGQIAEILRSQPAGSAAYPADRRKEARREGPQAAQGPTLGRGTNTRLVEQVPGDSGEIREEIMQLPGHYSVGLRSVVVSATVSVDVLR